MTQRLHPIVDGQKECAKCHTPKSIDDFFTDNSRYDKLTSKCKACIQAREAEPDRVAKRKSYKAQYHLDHAETINARTLQWQKDNPEKANAKNKRSKKKRQAERIAAGEITAPKKYRTRLESLAAGEKDCSQCEIVKPLGEFYAWERSPDGVQAECKDCHDGRNRPIYPRDEHILEKACSQCGITKAAVDFYDNPYVKSGIQAECKVCTRVRNDVWEQENPEKRKLYARRTGKKARQDPIKRVILYQKARFWKLTHPEAVAIHSKRDRQKAKHKPLRRATRRSVAAKRRALLRQATIVDTSIDVWVLYDRDQGVCTLCNFAVDRTACWPDLTMATVDHHIALSRGGPHSYLNTKLAHRWCNSLKHNRDETPELLAYIREQFARKFINPETQLVLLL